MTIRRIAAGSFLFGLIVLISGCIVAPREGFYDRAHNRYWHANAWHDCGVGDAHCR